MTISNLTGVTPGRHTSVVFDSTETVIQEPLWGMSRKGGEISADVAAGHVDDARHTNVKLWPTGAWTLRPHQDEVGNIQEYVAYQAAIVPPSKMTLIETLSATALMVAANDYRENSDLPGFAASRDIAGTGAPYIKKSIPAGTDWDNILPSGVPSVLGDNPPGVPLDRVGESTDPYPADIGYFLSWTVPGTQTSYPNFTLAFYFGQYAVVFTGSGAAQLWEFCQWKVAGNSVWVKRAEWKYARTGQVADTAHTMAIWPHHGPSGEKFIVFTNGQVDFAQVTSSYARTGASSVATGDFVYTAKPDARFADQSGRYVTIPAPFRFDIRRDLRLKLQISTLSWPLSGTLIDLPASLPPTATVNARPVQLYADLSGGPGTAITGSLIDPASGADFNPAVHLSPAAQFQFTGDGNGTPILWGYRMVRDPVLTTAAPGAFTGGHLRDVNIAGYSGDPTQETATLAIDDLTASMPRLLQRGQTPVLVAITDDVSGDVVPVFRGYVHDQNGEKKGIAGRVYPDGDFNRFTLPCTGMWARLAEAVQGPLLATLMGKDPTAPPDPGANFSSQPFTATYAISYLLQCAGFAPEEINIPDLPVRLWPGMSDSGDETVINPSEDFAEMALRIARNFLGAYLCYDTAAAAWTLLFGTALDAAPLLSFVTAPPRGRGIIAAHCLSSYPAGTVPIFGRPHTQPVKPSFNCVHVSCDVPLTDTHTRQTFDNWAFNFNSYAVPGSTIVPDPESPDYLGRCRMVEIIDPSLYVPGANSEAQTQAAVNWTARRIYDFTCHGQRLLHFRGPLAFVVDPLTGLRRLPRFGDPVTVNGNGYQVKACLPNYKIDRNQVADYELVQPVADGQFIPYGLESLNYLRTHTDRRSLKISGHHPDTNRMGLLGVPGHAEHRARNLPMNTAFRLPLQNSDGLFYDTADYGLAEGGIAR